MDPAEWDWTRIVVDHLDVHASDYEESVRFYETVLEPLGIPRIAETDKWTCFTNVNVSRRPPPTTGLHLCFHARSREQVDAFHAAGVAAGFRSNGEPGYRDYARATTPRTCWTRTATTSRRCTETRATSATACSTDRFPRL